MGSRFLLHSSILIFSLLLLGGCGAHKASDDDGPLTPMPFDNLAQDPDDPTLERAIQDYLRLSGHPASTRYDYVRIDLNGDTRRDALVMLKGPHYYWCDLNGCSMAVFRAHDDHFTLLSETFPIRGPFYIGDTATNGWRDLIVRVSGQSYARAKDVVLAHDGNGYPRNPIFSEHHGNALTLASTGQRVFP